MMRVLVCVMAILLPDLAAAQFSIFQGAAQCRGVRNNELRLRCYDDAMDALADAAEAAGRAWTTATVAASGARLGTAMSEGWGCQVEEWAWRPIIVGVVIEGAADCPARSLTARFYDGQNQLLGVGRGAIRGHVFSLQAGIPAPSDALVVRFYIDE